LSQLRLKIDEKIEHREFGKTGVKVSAIGMGTYYDFMSILSGRSLGYIRKRGDKVAALRKGIDLGINLIDTAEVYQTETLVAEAMRGYDREELFIATKALFINLRYDKVLKAAERSLRRLDTNYIDLYQIHQPSPWVPIKETMMAMEKLVEDGKVRYIGVSNFSLRQLEEAQGAMSRNELASNQVEYNLKVRRIENDLLPYCERNKIAVLAYRPVAHGALVKPSGNLRVAMDAISKKHGEKTPSQIVLNWLLCKNTNVFPIPRASRQKRVEENVGAMGWKMDGEDIMMLERAAS